ncbi:uncharacterized protein LOC133449172 [Cololabis saira]|uniref:uncharacterized protein LOC133449172 n=1 Tax=Cololabis saira TaxID=129043 RepID=UPI002AD1D582|nr:uncharacterized protein LOC133449172 [Cololabis saira]
MAQSLRHVYCSAPCCSNNKKNFPYLSFHDFPADAEVRARWVRAIRRDEGPNFKILRGSTFVCSQHFSPEDKTISASGRTRIKKGAVPSRFVWNDWGKVNYYSLPAVTPSVLERRQRPEDDSTEEEEMDVELLLQCHNYYKKPEQSALDTEKIDVQQRVIEELQKRLAGVTVKQSFGLERFSASDDDIRFYTRFASYHHLQAFWIQIEPATRRIVRVGTHSSTSCTTAAPDNDPPHRPSRCLPMIDELFLFLVYLSLGLNEKDLGDRFSIHQSTVSRIIKTWCKSHTTLKGMIGVSPHGAVTFVSSLYSGSVSDKELFRQSGIIPLLDKDMAVMVDKGFGIDDVVPCKVYRPPFLTKGSQLSHGEVLVTQDIARLRIHVERTIKHIKENKLFDTIIPLTICGSINQLFAVACLLSNYQNKPPVKVWAI